MLLFPPGLGLGFATVYNLMQNGRRGQILTGDAATPADRKRIGEILRDRRTRIDSRYGNRELFLRERDQGMANRSFYALEGGEPRKFDAGTVVGFTVAYELPPGWLAAALAGNIQPLPDPGEARFSPGRIVEAIEFLADEVSPARLDAIEEFLVGSDLTPEMRTRMWALWKAIAVARVKRDGPPVQDAGSTA